MDNMTDLQQVIFNIFELLTVIFLIISIILTVYYQKGMMDIKGTKKGLRKSTVFLLLAFGSGAIMILAENPTRWLSSFCVFIFGIILVTIYYSVRSQQLSTFEKIVPKKIFHKRNGEK